MIRIVHFRRKYRISFLCCLLIVIAWNLFIVGCQNSLAKRVIDYSDTIKDTRLWGSTLMIKTGVTKLHCATECTQTTLCRSFNFCRPNICELNRDDVFSIKSRNDVFIPPLNTKWFYFYETQWRNKQISNPKFRNQVDHTLILYDTIQLIQFYSTFFSTLSFHDHSGIIYYPEYG